MTYNTDVQDSDIAIIGISGRFPGANDINEFWKNLIDGNETLSHLTRQEMLDDGVLSELIDNKNYINIAGVMPNYKMFDNEFFGYSKKEALLMDPQYRVFLEESWKAFEHAGYDPLSSDLTIGVFAGAKPSNYLSLYQKATQEDLSAFEWGLYAEASQLATRISFDLNLKGPSMYILTACSTSLVALHVACQSLLNGECDMALVGAVAIQVPQKAGYLYKPGLIFSPDGHCRSFDENAAGTILSNGVGVVIIKKLSDAIQANDRIEAVIKGTAINNDGNRKVGFTAPSVDGQAEVIASAISFANIDVETISYIEAHGTGTKIGDPIEIEGLVKAFRHFTNKSGFCKIGSVKPNIGHLDVAAGMAGLIKTIFCLKNRQIPATLHFNKLNSNIDLENSPFQINHKLSSWEPNNNKLRAGVSSFGFGGTNAHVLLESTSQLSQQSNTKNSVLICLSAKNKTSLEYMSANLSHFLENNLDVSITDVAYTLQTGRHHFNYRKAVSCSTLGELQLALTKHNSLQITQNKPNKIIFMFPGQGSQYINMAKQLYADYHVFRNHMNECFNLLFDIAKFNIMDIIFVDDLVSERCSEKLKSTQYAQLALFIVEYSLSKFLQSLNIIPDLMLGHSVGEYCAACLSGVMTLKDSIYLLYHRSQLMQNTAHGSMMAVFAPIHIIEQKLLDTNLSIAAINNKDLCVVSGSAEQITILRIELAKTYKCIDLHTSHAFHSVTMEPILEAFQNICSEIKLNLVQIPYMSNLTGKMVEIGESMLSDYWVLHLKNTVQFYDSITYIKNPEDCLFIEIGPGNTLSSLVKQIHPKAVTVNVLPTAKKIEYSGHHFNNALGEIWSTGINLNFLALYYGENHMRLALPGYHFIRNDFWPTQHNDISFTPIEFIKERNSTIKQQENVRDTLCGIWKEHFAIKEHEIDNQDFFLLGGDSLSAIYFIDKINIVFNLSLPITWIYENSSFYKQCGAIERSNFKDHTNKLIVFNEKPNSIPLFLVHPSRAGAEVYKDICDVLGNEYYICGINSYYLNNDDYSIISIENLAATYIEYIKSVKPHGPYFLGGWSMGGVIAYEIANQMMANGDKILAVYMFDSAVTNLCPKNIFIDSTPVFQKLLRHDKQFIDFPKNLQDKLLKQVEIDNLLLGNYNNYRDSKYPVILYKAQNILSMQGSLVLTSEETAIYNNFFATLFHDSTNDWSNYITNLKIIMVNACHMSIMQPPYLHQAVSHMIDDLKRKTKCA